MSYISDLGARDRILRARAALITSQPFYGCLALGLELVEDSTCETMATDGRRLFYAPAFVESLSEPELIGVLAHEVTHLAYLHHTRRGGRELPLWNEAADYAINRDLVAAGFTLPADVLLDSSFDGQGAESIYATLKGRRPQPQPQEQQEPEPAPQQDGTETGQGAPQTGADDSAPDDSGNGQSGASGQSGQNAGQSGEGGADGAADPGAGGNAPAGSDPGRCGGILDAAPDGASMAEAAAEMESRVRQAIAVAAAGAGELPGSLARILGALNEPRIAWRDVVARFVDDAAVKATCWNRPNKRFLDSPFFLPGSTVDSVRQLAVAVDTSGSIDDAVLAAFSSEVQGMLDSGKVESVHVVYCDSSVQGSAEYELGDAVELKPLGGGGTAFAPAFAHIAEHAPEAAAIVYLTDLDCSPSRFGDEPAAPVLWAVHGKLRSAPWGEVMPIDPYA
jgi:predicted metal-dependent peptidase